MQVAEEELNNLLSAERKAVEDVQAHANAVGTALHCPTD